MNDDSIAPAMPPASRAPAIARAAAILRLLGKSAAPLGVQAIARELGLVPSTCLYVLRALAEEELIAFDPDTKRYALGAGTLTLARQWLRRSEFADLAQPQLDQLSRSFDATMLGVQIAGLDHMVVVALSQSRQNFQLSAHIGSRFPALISATGRCIAAFSGYSDTELEARFRTLRWDESPPFETWMAEVAQARELGFAIDDGNYISGVTVASAPVWKAAAGKPSHALVAIGIGGALKRSGMADLTAALAASARTLSHQLSGVA
jgi:DNA-binding IclR family transcriptional regulator